MPRARTIELHFQDGFFNDAVEILRNGEVVASFTASTRTQVGLARAEKITAADGDRISVRLTATGRETVVELQKTSNYYMIVKKNGDIEARGTEIMPRYM